MIESDMKEIYDSLYTQRFGLIFNFPPEKGIKWHSRQCAP